MILLHLRTFLTHTHLCLYFLKNWTFKIKKYTGICWNNVSRQNMSIFIEIGPRAFKYRDLSRTFQKPKVTNSPFFKQINTLRESLALTCLHMTSQTCSHGKHVQMNKMLMVLAVHQIKPRGSRQFLLRNDNSFIC